MKSFFTLLKNECKLSLRDMNMVIFAVAMPLIVLVILWIIYGGKIAAPGTDYTFLEQSFGALCAISMCAGGLMGLPIVVADYRARKILKRFRVTPMSPALLLGVELCMYILYCSVSLILCLAVAVVFFKVRFMGNIAAFLGSWFLTMLSTLSIVMMVGGVAKNAKSASVIACILYFPMLIFSGATLPLEVMPLDMQKVMSVFPLTQGIQLMKTTFLGLPATNIWLPIFSMAAVIAVCTGIAVKFFKWE